MKCRLLFILHLALATGTDEVTEKVSEDSSENVVKDSLENWEAPDEIKKNYPYYLGGFDYENRPIWIVEVGKWDFTKIVEKGGQELKDFDTYLKQGFQMFAKGPPKEIYPKGDRGEGSILIVDADGFSLAQISSISTLRFFIKLAGQLRDVQDNLAYGYFVNLNSVAETVLNLVRPVLGTTMERMEIYGSNSAKWVPRLLRNIPREAIPEKYGGVSNFTPLAVYG